MNLLEFFVCFGLFSWGRGRGGGGGGFLSVLYGGEDKNRYIDIDLQKQCFI